MKEWPHRVDPMSRDDMLDAVSSEQWQTFRRSLKGLSTEDKLDALQTYLQAHPGRKDKIRIDNYINALLRGGQLLRQWGGAIVVYR